MLCLRRAIKSSEIILVADNGVVQLAAMLVRHESTQYTFRMVHIRTSSHRNYAKADKGNPGRFLAAIKPSKSFQYRKWMLNDEDEEEEEIDVDQL